MGVVAACCGTLVSMNTELNGALPRKAHFYGKDLWRLDADCLIYVLSCIGCGDRTRYSCGP